ncbi:MAG: phospho-sugar mutase, partial [Demequina sp.]
ANAPDADRCAVATVIDGRWQMLHGAVVGALMGERVASLGDHPEGAVLANSIVSSQMLGRIAEAHGLTHAYTLTGFKWIGREPGLVFGYEEALGYCVAPDLVRDKDGVSAAVLVAEYVSELKAEGRTLADAIDDLARDYGVHLTRQVSARFTDIAEIPALMERLLASPPDALAGSPVTSTDDMNAGFRGLPPTNGLHLATESGARVIIRPSGTEPKIKAYLEVVEPASASVQDSRERAEDAMDALEADVRSLLGV